MPHADVNGQSLYYEVHGEGEPIFAIQGLGADIASWIPQIQAWSAGNRLILFENRDVGRSSRADGPYEVTDMAADALALADHLELDSFHLVGMSLGGTIAQELALAAPERVRTLTLIVSYAWSGNWGRTRARVWGGMVKRMSREDHVDNLMLMAFSQQFFENPDYLGYVRQAILDNPHPQEPDAFVRQLEAGSRHDARDRLGSLGMPVHVIGGELDGMVPVWKSKELAELIPRARLTIIERAPHAMNVENAEELNSAVIGFLSSAEARQAVR